MFEVLISYIQFLIIQISGHFQLFLLVFLGVPAFWLVLKLTNILYEEKALTLGAWVFGACSLVAMVMFIVHSSPADFYKPLLILLAGILTFICVAPIYSENQDFEINKRQKYFVIDGSSFPASLITQVNVKRSFTRTSRSCMMEIFISEKGKRARTVYYETNDVAKFREVLEWIKKFTKVEYDTEFTRLSLENPSFIVLFFITLLALFVFCLILPASFSLKEKRETKALPEYNLIPIPVRLKNKLEDTLILDPFKTVFTKKGIQIIVFDGAHSTKFVENLRKALYSYQDQSYDYNIVFVTNRGLSLKTALDGKVALDADSDKDIYTKFVLENCNKFCLVDNYLGVFYKTDLETIDPRVNNIQDAINMLSYTSQKRMDEIKKVNAAHQKALAKKQEEEAEEDEY